MDPRASLLFTPSKGEHDAKSEEEKKKRLVQEADFGTSESGLGCRKIKRRKFFITKLREARLKPIVSYYFL